MQAVGGSACARVCGALHRGCAGAGRASAGKHSAQSSVCRAGVGPVLVSLDEAEDVISLTTPSLEQSNCMLCGLSKGAAVAAPTANTKHARTQRLMARPRSKCIHEVGISEKAKRVEI